MERRCVALPRSIKALSRKASLPAEALVGRL